MTGLVIGSMIPDFEYFIRMNVKSLYSHSWLGLFWFDLPLGLIVVLIFNKVVKDCLIDHLPVALNRRISIFKGNSKDPFSVKYFVIVGFCVLTGAASHLLWDSFTHPGGYFVYRISFLRHQLNFDGHTIRVYNVAQHISTLIGFLTIFWIVFVLPKKENTQKKNIFNYWIVILAVTFITVIVRFSNGVSLSQFGTVIVTGISGLFIGVIIASLINKKAS